MNMPQPMTSSHLKKNPASSKLKAGIPVGLIALTSGLLWFFLPRAESTGKLKKGVTYAIWITEAEVAPRNSNGAIWDMDSSAPDLFAMVAWQEQVVLSTVVNQDGLIARWEPVAIDVKSVLQGEISTSSMQRVARVRLGMNQSIEVAIFDDDLLDREFAGGVRIDLESLSLGRNEIVSSGNLRRLQITVADAVEQASPTDSASDYQVGNPIVFLDQAPAVMASTSSDLRKQVQETTGAISQEAKVYLGDTEKAMQEASQAIQEQVDSATKWLQENLPSNP
jgi:hypothetical protein